MIQNNLNRYKQIINNYSLRLFDKIVLNTNCWPKKYHYDLVITRTDRIGDFILSLDSLQALLDAFEGKRILYVCRSFTADIVKNSGLFTDVMVVDDIDSYWFERSFCYHFKYIRKLIEIEADYVVNPVWSRISPTDWVVKYIKAKHKIGCDGDQERTFHESWANRYYTKLVTGNPYDSELLNNQYFINETFNSTFRARLPKLEMIYKKESPIIEGKYIVIGISASSKERVWPMERMAEVINHIPVNYCIVLIGRGEDDIERARSLKEGIDNKHIIKDLINKTSMNDMFNLIANAKMVIGMDSGPIHIAAAARVPSICIGHGAHYGRFIPYPDFAEETPYCPRVLFTQCQKCFKCNYQCSRNGYERGSILPCLSEVTVEMVVNELKRLLRDL